MATSTLTSKGQITIPKEIRDHLTLNVGDRLDFVITQDGTVEVRALERHLEDLDGFLERPGGAAASVEEIDAALAEERVADDERIQSTRAREEA